jgi:hypothetical protein
MRGFMKYLFVFCICYNVFAEDNSHGYFNGTSLVSVKKDPITGKEVTTNYQINIDTEDAKDESTKECLNENEMNDCYTTRVDTIDSLNLVMDERKTGNEDLGNQIEIESSK